MKRWFSAVLIFETVTSAIDDTSLREESIRVFLSDSDESAGQRAEEIGQESEHSYKNENDENVSWQFIRVLEIHDLDIEQIVDNTEILSRMAWVD